MLLSTLFAGGSLPADEMLNEESNLKCSQVISSHIGWKLKYCGK
jgi:hypothetical protein